MVGERIWIGDFRETAVGCRDRMLSNTTRSSEIGDTDRRLCVAIECKLRDQIEDAGFQSELRAGRLILRLFMRQVLLKDDYDG